MADGEVGGGEPGEAGGECGRGFCGEGGGGVVNYEGHD